ncbi:MAG: hypothetical protein ACLQBK_02950 [Candidatus Sulfotelmatobacter sp.]
MRHFDSVPFLLFGGFIALVVVLIVWGNRYARKRAQDLAEVAQQIGFTFLGKMWSGPVLSPQHRISLLQRTRGGFNNVMTGSVAGLQAALFDYTYPEGKGSATQTLGAFSQDLQLPAFELRTENVFDRIEEAFAPRDIDFDSHREFSKRFFLRSPDEAATRELFTPALLTYFEQMPADKKWHIEGSGTTLMIYRWRGPLPASEIRSFLEETSTIARTVLGAGGLKNRAVSS